jgi:hypothetical protein
VLERERLQPRYRGLAHTVGPREIGLRAPRAWTCDVRASEGGAYLAKRAQPTDGRGIDGVRLCDIGQGFARIEPLESFLPLVGCQLRRTAKLHSTGLRAFPALTCTSTDQFALEPRLQAPGLSFRLLDFDAMRGARSALLWNKLGLAVRGLLFFGAELCRPP